MLIYSYLVVCVYLGNITGDTSEFKNLLREIWFNMYSRQRGQLGSSGFEHVFLGELKNNQVSGFHNWLFFSEEEMKGGVDYLGYMKKVDLNDVSSWIHKLNTYYLYKISRQLLVLTYECFRGINVMRELFL